MLLTEKAKQRIPFLLGAIILMYIVKPSILFKPNGKPRIYGIGYDDEGYKKTLYNMQFAILIIVVLIYIFS
jgi:hypothetical protein